ncbi:MAG TPA: MarC family protein [Alphaproteobacteria bacterium]|nr:MarC family protein [Alphaproteobacteria bacterium]
MLLDLALTSFVTLFVVLDPPGMGPIFVAITRGESRDYRRRMALRGSVVALIILLIFAFSGDLALRGLGISIAAFRIAGGILLLLIAIDMLFARATPLRRTTEAEEEEAEHKRDISVFPLAIPLIAGPGALTSTVLLMGRTGDSLVMKAVVLAALIAVMAIMLAVLLQGDRINRLLGETGTNVVGRVFGIVLAALAVQYVIDGIKEAF